MPDLEFEFNQQDRDLVVTPTDGNFSEMDYIRLTIYPTEAINNIADLPDDTKGIDGKAIFFSSRSSSFITINISPFTDNTQFEQKIIGGRGLSGEIGENDFKIYRNETTQDIYIKPNEIFNDFELPQGNYRIQIDFLNQLEPIKEIPYWFEDFDFNGDGNLNPIDSVGWVANNRVDIANLVTSFTSLQNFPPKYMDWVFNNEDNEAVSYTHLTLPTICSV